MTPYSPQTIAAIHKRLDRALEVELDRLASANAALHEDRYKAGVSIVAGILRQLADEVEQVGG